MNLEKFKKQMDAGIAADIIAVGPDTVAISLPEFCPHTGNRVTSPPEQMNLQAIDETIAQIESQRGQLADSIVELRKLRALVADKLGK